MPRTVETPELLHIQVQHLARPVPGVAPYRSGWIQHRQPIEPGALQHAANGGHRHPGARMNLTVGASLATQRNDPLAQRMRRPMRTARRARTPIAQPRFAFIQVAAAPLVGSAHTHTRCLRRFLGPKPLFQHPPNQKGSTIGRQSGMLMAVHPGPLARS